MSQNEPFILTPRQFTTGGRIRQNSDRPVGSAEENRMVASRVVDEEALFTIQLNIIMT